MECKYKEVEIAKAKASRINRYIMECKYHRVRLVFLAELELIDTLWNVNRR